VTAVGFFGIKFGFGMMEAGANSQLIRLRSARPAALMSLMHLFFGVGSSLGALYAGQALGLGWGWAAVLALSGAIPVLVCMLAAMVRLPDQAAPRPASAGARGPFALFARPEIWIMAGLLTFAVATEVGATSWLVAYLQQGKGMNHKNASLILTAFLISFTLGRLALGWVAERIGYIRLLLISMGFTALSGAAACLLPGGAPLFLVMAFTLAPAFPVTVTAVSRIFPAQTGSAIGLVTALNGLANMGLQLVVGRAADRMGIAMGMLLVPAFALFSAGFAAVLGRLRQKAKD
jgi:predicted MFS family arabinose efflux permease